MLKSYFSKGLLEAGCDEVGRGCLAGPVVAAAVILPPHFSHKILNDSKKLNAQTREGLVEEIKRQSLAWSISEVSSEEIDRINILKASFLAMHKAVDSLNIKPDLLLIDGNKFTAHTIPHRCVIKGDSIYYAIAAASVLAKTYRDKLMRELALEYSKYKWNTNVGYPTKAHREGIEKYGITPYHRKSFRLLLN